MRFTFVRRPFVESAQQLTDEAHDVRLDGIARTWCLLGAQSDLTKDGSLTARSRMRIWSSSWFSFAWPLADHLHLLASVADVDGDQATGVWRLVDAEAGHAADLGIKPGVVVAEEADLRTDAQNQVIQPFRFACPPGSPAMPLEDHSGGSIVNQEHVCSPSIDQGVDLVPSVVALPVCLQIARPTPVVGRPEASAEAPDRDRFVPLGDVEPLPVAQIEHTGQHLGIGLVVQPDEILVVALDEQGLPWSAPPRSAHQAGKSPAPSCRLVAPSMRVASGQIPKSPTWNTHAKRTPSESSKARTSS